MREGGRTMRGPGLSDRLLLLTILFVMLSEVLIYVPSIANFRQSWLRDRLNAAQIAALVLDAAPDDMVPEGLQRELLSNVGAHAVALKRADSRRLLAIADMPPDVAWNEDMRETGVLDAIMHAFMTLASTKNRAMRVVGDAPMGGEFVEIIIDEKPLREAMLRYSANILTMSVIISLITASLVYLTLNWLMVRPMRRLTANMVAFAQHPESPERVIEPSGRGDEIGVAESELSDMQRQLAAALHQKTHLAQLGLAVSKINHDLRNLLAAAQIIVDRVGAIPEPTVQRFAPKLIDTLDRAIRFCTDTLKYGHAQESRPQRVLVKLGAVVDEAAGVIGLDANPGIRFVNAVDPALMVDADPDQLFRILANLGRNAVQAMAAAPGDGDELRVDAERQGAAVAIRVADTGPGVPEKARAHLFEAFHGSTNPGGTGLGLAIAAELVRAHEGTIELAPAGRGAAFRIVIPDRTGIGAAPQARPRAGRNGAGDDVVRDA
ncbi:MAG: sensor histidine kinase [Flavobacteriaceae bacterium]